MTEPRRVEILCEGNDRVGYGHIRRSLTLAARLQKDGVAVCLSGLSEAARRALPPPEPFEGMAPVVIFDSPLGIDDQIRAAGSRGQLSVTLDWFGEAVPDVNIAVFPHHAVRASRKSFVGFEYVLVREEIAALHGIQPTCQSRRVLVVIGGGDLLGQGQQAARHLAESGFEVTLVQGPWARAVDTAGGFRVLVNPPDLPQQMAAADWMVTNGGGCLFEALCLGKAAYVLPQTDMEVKIAQYARDKGAILGMGLDALRGFEADELAPVGGHGARLIDGRGGERISAIVREWL